MFLCKYICVACGHRFVRLRPQMVSCELCGGVYVEWVNWVRVVRDLVRTDMEYAVHCGPKIKLYIKGGAGV